MLYFNGCPSWEEGLKNLRSALEGEKLPANIILVEIKDDDEAASQEFLGSPSFRINGEPLWPETRTRFDLSCRVYTTSGGLTGTPTVEMLRNEIRKFVD